MATTRLVVKWFISSWALSDLANDRKTMTDSEYKDQRNAFRDMLRAYFESEKCVRKSSNINPIDGAPSGLKAFKVRWSRPGQGKSGGYRILINVDCVAQEVAVQRVFLRSDHPTDTDYAKAAARGMTLIPVE